MSFQSSHTASLDLDSAQALAHRAFNEDDRHALEEAHRYLYASYAERVWHYPASVPSGEEVRVREILEVGFRAQLDRRRYKAGVLLDPPKQSQLARWFEFLANDAHPFEEASWGEYLRERASFEGIRGIVQQRSLRFMREHDPRIYAVPSLSGPAKDGLINLLLDEYGWANFDRNHSSAYASVMEYFRLDPTPDHYENETSWQYLATLNHQWMCALDHSLIRRLIGTIYQSEANSPAMMNDLMAAWARVGFDDPKVIEFYERHVKVSKSHREIALREVAVPVAIHLGDHSAREIAIGIFDARTLEADFARSEMVLAAPRPRGR